MTTKCSKGFTLIEFIFVTILIATLVSIAIMQLFGYLDRGYNATLQIDLRSAYRASVLFYIDHACDEVTEDDLKEYGYRPSNKNITLTVIDGGGASLKITAGHPQTENVYAVDHTGRVSKQ